MYKFIGLTPRPLCSQYLSSLKYSQSTHSKEWHNSHSTNSPTQLPILTVHSCTLVNFQKIFLTVCFFDELPINQTSYVMSIIHRKHCYIYTIWGTYIYCEAYVSVLFVVVHLGTIYFVRSNFSSSFLSFFNI